jgi:hypothetical protein
MILDINGKALTTCQVDSAGDAFRLNFESVDGQPASLTLPSECLRALLMTLPRLTAQALRAKYRDDTLKVVYPVGDWSLQLASDRVHRILTLGTPDGFEVSFALQDEDAVGLAASLGERQHDPAILTPNQLTVARRYAVNVFVIRKVEPSARLEADQAIAEPFVEAAGREEGGAARPRRPPRMCLQMRHQPSADAALLQARLTNSERSLSPPSRPCRRSCRRRADITLGHLARELSGV